jgi:hypothetical protein
MQHPTLPTIGDRLRNQEFISAAHHSENSKSWILIKGKKCLVSGPKKLRPILSLFHMIDIIILEKATDNFFIPGGNSDGTRRVAEADA